MASQASAIKQTRSTAFIGTVKNGHVSALCWASRRAGASTRGAAANLAMAGWHMASRVIRRCTDVGWSTRRMSGSRVVRLGFAAEIAGRQTKALTKGGGKIGLIAITAVAGNLLHRQCAFCQQPAGF